MDSHLDGQRHVVGHHDRGQLSQAGQLGPAHAVAAVNQPVDVPHDDDGPVRLRKRAHRGVKVCIKRNALEAEEQFKDSLQAHTHFNNNKRCMGPRHQEADASAALAAALKGPGQLADVDGILRADLDRLTP